MRKKIVNLIGGMYMWITILGCIISSVVSVILSDKIINSIDKVLIKLGLSKKADISGTWRATFESHKAGKKSEYIEIIKLRNRMGLVLGNITPHNDNYPALKEYMHKMPLRVKGSIADNMFFTGFWYHPIDSYRFHGSYQLLISGTLDKMEGQWIGYSESGKMIDYGKWKWVKISK